MRPREFAASVLGEKIAQAVQLAQPPTVVNAPPSDAPDYPAVAIWVEKSDLVYAMDQDLEVDANGVLIAGINADNGDLFDPQFTEGDLALVAPGVSVSNIGTIRCAGRIWVGARHAGRREEVEEKIEAIFFADRAAPGRILLPLAGARMLGFRLAFGYAAAVLESSQWSNEQAFGERLWSWLTFDLDVPLMVARPDAAQAIKHLYLEFSSNVDATIETVADLPKLTDLEIHEVVDGEAIS